MASNVEQVSSEFPNNFHRPRTPMKTPVNDDAWGNVVEMLVRANKEIGMATQMAERLMANPANNRFYIAEGLDLFSHELATDCFEASRMLVIKLLEGGINTILPTMWIQNDTASYQKKKKNVEYINDNLRKKQAAIQNPTSGEPCMLLAVGSPDGFGRYILENRITKQRSHTCKSIKDLFPVKLMPDVPRKEGVIERRKKQAEEKLDSSQSSDSKDVDVE